MDTLPEPLRAYAAQAAASLHCPVDFLAVPLLAAAGVALGHAAALELKSDYHEQANLYTAIVGRPGDRKSPALAKALAPVQRWQQRLTREYEQARDAYIRRLAAWEAQPKRERGPKPDEPVPPGVYTTDATCEALAVLLLRAKGVLLHRDELSGWIASMNQYRAGGRGADRQFFLSAWARVPLKIDRKHQGPLYVPCPFLAVTGGVQPDLLPALADAQSREDGFPDRLLWAYPDPLPPGGWPEATLDEPTQAAVGALFARLFQLQPAMSPEGLPLPRTVPLSPAARAQWRAWYGDWEQQLHSPTLPQWLHGWWAKLPAHVARLALILHLCHETPPDQLPGETLEAAIALGEYFAAHAKRVFTALGQRRQGLAVRVLAILREHGARTTRELHEALSRHVAASRLRAVLEELEEAGLVAREQRSSGGRPATVWHLAGGG